MKLEGCVAVITGGAGGIGLELCRGLLRRNCSVAICDYSAERLQKVEATLAAFRTDLMARNAHFTAHASYHEIDIRNRSVVEKVCEDIAEAHGSVSVLINNASVGANELLENSAWEDIDCVLDINIKGAINCTKVLMSELCKAKESYVVNVSSLEGLVAVPGNISYCTSKFAIKGFSDALRIDNMLTRPSVRVLCVHPGLVRTDMMSNNQSGVNSQPLAIKGYGYSQELSIEKISGMFKSMGSTTPETAALSIIRAIEANKSRLVIGTDCKIIDLAFRLFPEVLYKKYLYLPFISSVQVLVRYVGMRMLIALAALFLIRRARRD